MEFSQQALNLPIQLPADTTLHTKRRVHSEVGRLCAAKRSLMRTEVQLSDPHSVPRLVQSLRAFAATSTREVRSWNLV